MAVLAAATVTVGLIPALGQRPTPRPLYVVNGEERSDIGDIPPDEIEHIETLPADEETIARYGEKASNGVMLITLRYDRPARFSDTTTFDRYIAQQVRWDDDEPVARVVLRYTVGADGAVTVGETLESTDNRLKRRVVKAVEEAPRWIPAQKHDQGVASEGVLRVQLPEGRRMPRRVELVY